ncbi:MAG TPA: MBL fold metallo-hydrolase, partial [Pyrinomonadaceae bacterium]|nr:MBL fold metallo-hydrolase [Pyrinomonadaceae bacterium]
ADTWKVEVRDPSEFLASGRDGILWLGHASFYIRVNGVGILTDPIFGTPPVVKRYVEVPSPLEHITKVDYVLLSHDHRDHMDETTLRDVANKFPNARFLAGLRSEDVLTKWSTPTNLVGTAGWFQEFALADDRLQVYFLPVRHWSRRGLFDTNRRLWGGYIIKTDTATIYFGGDSGYGSHYRETAELFPKIDYFLIGIGAYEPRWFMEANHNNPSDVVKAFVDSGARYLVPMHYGTFDLSDEPPSQPLRLLREQAEKAGVSDRVRAVAINDVITF